MKRTDWRENQKIVSDWKHRRIIDDICTFLKEEGKERNTNQIAIQELLVRYTKKHPTLTRL